MEALEIPRFSGHNGAWEKEKAIIAVVGKFIASLPSE
jgi:hypothetical protein